MIEKKVSIRNKLGLHARPVTMLVKTAREYESDILLTKDDIEVDAKDTLSLMMLGADKGSEIKLKADGKDEKEAIKAICELIKRGFDEE